MNRIKSSLYIFIICTALSFSIHAREKEPYCTWGTGVTETRIDAADALLLSERRPTQRERVNQAIEEHLPFGLPASTNSGGEHLLAQEHYLIWYDNDLRSPMWTAHRMTQTDSTQDRTRVDSFRSDPRLQWYQQADCTDFKEPIFDQGHMVPRADMNRSDSAMDQTFLMSNMTPQHCAFNRGIWQILEKLARQWANTTDDTWIISGTIFDRDGKPGRDADQVAWRMSGKRGMRVAIPSHQYKIIVKRKGQNWKSLAFILPNSDNKVTQAEASTYLTDHITTLANIAEQSGYRFLKNKVVTESTTLWVMTGEMPSSLAANCHADYTDY